MRLKGLKKVCIHHKVNNKFKLVYKLHLVKISVIEDKILAQSRKLGTHYNVGQPLITVGCLAFETTSGHQMCQSKYL